MTTPDGSGAGGPLIAGGMPSGEYNDISDEELSSSNFFDFSNSPDTLQSLETIGVNDQKSFLNPQDLTAGPFPDSPNESYQDSSSESASSTKRAESSVSAKTPATTGDASMQDANDVKMEWANPSYSTFDDEENAFAFGTGVDPSGMNGLYGFNEQDDSFMDQSFDFESASSSPEAQNGGQPTMASPAMPTIKSNTPKKPVAKAGQKHKKQNSVRHESPKQHHRPHYHTDKSQQFSTSTLNGGLKQAGSREVSPMSTMVTSHDSSPAMAFFNSPSPSAGTDFSGINGSAVWPNRVDMNAPSGPDSLPTPVHFGAPMGQPSIPLGQHMSMFTPPYSFTGGYELRIMPTPLKSRVETQIPIKMTLSPLPPGVTKLHLPAHTISKPKLLAKPAPERSPDTLELHVNLVCTSAMEDPEMKKAALERATLVPQGFLPNPDEDEGAPQRGGDVRICLGCITRERKRAARKKIKKPEEEKVWSQDEERRVIVFNTQEVKEWQPLSGVLDVNGRPDPMVTNRAMQVDAPMRIACYCRHHGEKMGFNVIFTIKDFQDRVIAQAMSNPIMITDDHKTHPMAQLSAQPAMSEPVTSSTMPHHSQQSTDANMVSPPSAARVSQSSNDGSQRDGSTYANSASGKTTPTMATASGPPRMSRPGSPSQGGPTAKKRKSSGSRVPNGLSMTKLDTSPAPGSQMSTTSPFTPNGSAFQQSDVMFSQPNGAVPYANGPPTPSSNDQASYFGNNRSASMDNLAMAQLYSAPTSNHPSRAPSPNGLRNAANGVPQNQFAQALANNLYSLPMGVNQAQARAPPVIHKIIPNEGPKIGGIEVTVLGAAFLQGLEVWFGDQKATTTTFWGESSLVCLLPPSPVAGAVPVMFKHHGVPAQNFTMGKQPPTFKYVDDNEDKLIRTALSVLGHKMSGQMVDVSDLARRILNDGNSGWSGGSSGPSAGGPGFNQASTSNEHLESQLLKCLDLIDLDDSSHRTRLDLKRPTGHTMLHLACSLGYHRFVAALLARGANPDARDKGGFTPLHMAAIHNHSEIVRRLMLVGADPTIRSLSSLTAADCATSRAVLRVIRTSERHARSRSGGSLHSRTNSATSLRSLWEPLTRSTTHEEPLRTDSGSESPEYTSGDFEDEDPDENTYLSMKSRRGRRQMDGESNSDQDDSDGADSGMESPTRAYRAGLKDQFQQQFHQFQQSMAMHFQNLPQLPQIRQMPAFTGMPMFPDYQAYLQRMQQFMPAMSGLRPGSAGDNPSKEDNRWWDFSSYMNSGGAAAPPPAYDEIFPDKDLDTKHASAAQAAAEAEADMKCASKYDQGSAPTTTEEKAQLPSVLKIGRKNEITKEQQDNFLRAREQKLKRLSSDRNLFFVWVSKHSSLCRPMIWQLR